MTVPVAMTVLGLAGCQSGSVPEPAPVETSATPIPTSTPTPTPAEVECLTGDYRVLRLTRTSGDGGGEGGDLTANFSQGGFVLTGAGQDPVKATVQGRHVDLLVTGSIRGTYTGSGSTGAYVIAGTDGTATVSAGILRRTVPMSEVAQLLAPDGTGSLGCDPGQLTMTSSASRIDLQRA